MAEVSMESFLSAIWNWVTLIGRQLEPIEIIISLLTLMFAGYASLKLC
jgi:hypothetical protein